MWIENINTSVYWKGYFRKRNLIFVFENFKYKSKSPIIETKKAFNFDADLIKA